MECLPDNIIGCMREYDIGAFLPLPPTRRLDKSRNGCKESEQLDLSSVSLFDRA